MADALTYDMLLDAISGRAAALRARGTLQPAGGPGTKVFPPTYAGAVYATEERRVEGRDEPVRCVLLDSVQSQANRMEEALQEALDRGELEEASLPIVEVDFAPFWPGDDKDASLRLLDPVGRVSSLEAPHRIADAILRDSLLDGVGFRESEVGERIGRASARNATALFEHCPTALLFGMWDSTGPKGGLGAKIERTIVSEIVGIDAVFGVSTSSRIDPLGIQLSAGPVYEAVDGEPFDWTLDENKARKEKNKPKPSGKKGGKPSEINHGNVTPSLSDVDHDTERYLAGGVTIDHAEHSTVISLAALRRLRFPADDEWQPKNPEQHQRDDAARVVLAALGVLASTLATRGGMDLRSRCLLWPETPPSWELLSAPGESTPVTVDVETARAVYAEAVRRARSLGLPWRTEPLVLEPSSRLVQLVVKSQELAAKQGASEAEAS